MGRKEKKGRSAERPPRNEDPVERKAATSPASTTDAHAAAVPDPRARGATDLSRSPWHVHTPDPRARGATVVADVNEPPEIVDALLARGVAVERERLAPADFVVGTVAIERKTVRDFYQSMLRKRLFEQLVRLKETYPEPVVLLLEGDLAYVEGLLRPRPFWGALVAAAVDVGVRVVPTPSLEASAEVVGVLARRMAEDGRSADVRFKPRMLGPLAEQQFAVQGLPGVGDVLSANLLQRFGSVRRVFTASTKDLLRTPGVGKKKADAIAAFLDRPFASTQARLPSTEEASDAPEDADG